MMGALCTPARTLKPVHLLVAVASLIGVVFCYMNVWPISVYSGPQKLRPFMSRSPWAGLVGTPSGELTANMAAGGFPVACTSDSVSKQSCMFRDVCLHLSNDKQALAAVLWSSEQQEHAAVLQQHLAEAFQGGLNVSTRLGMHDNTTTESMHFQHAPTIIWTPDAANQASFGHALVNEAFSIFLVLSNHFGHELPKNLQLLNSRGGWHPVLHQVVMNTITKDVDMFLNKLANVSTAAGMCFRQLLVGDGGYISTSRASLSGSVTPHPVQYSKEPSFFSSANWWYFRQHTFEINGLPMNSTAAGSGKRVTLNDKRYGQDGAADRRMILDINTLAYNLTALYPGVEASAVRFRDLEWAQQLQILAQTDVFITTQGSSAFRLVFLPPGATCIMVGSPAGKNTPWTAFHELDRWFPLTYVQFKRYEVDNSSSDEYQVKVTGDWQPADEEGRRNWWLYNANIRIKVDRLQQLLKGVLEGP